MEAALSQMFRSFLCVQLVGSECQTLTSAGDPMTRVLQSHTWRFLGARCASSFHDA